MPITAASRAPDARTAALVGDLETIHLQSDRVAVCSGRVGQQPGQIQGASSPRSVRDYAPPSRDRLGGAPELRELGLCPAPRRFGGFPARLRSHLGRFDVSWSAVATGVG